MPSDNETWIIEFGQQIIEKESSSGSHTLAPIEKLINCLWVADYGMRNAGDLETARDLEETFQEDAARLAATLKLNYTCESFTLHPNVLEKEYFDRFDRICNEIRAAIP